jgi:hypothetical protein
MTLIFLEFAIGIAVLTLMEAKHRMTKIYYANLTPGKQQKWLETQPLPTTPEQVQAIKWVLRLLKLSQEEEAE